MNECSYVQVDKFGGARLEDKNIDFERCDCTVIHDEIVNSVKKSMPDEEIGRAHV